MKTKIYISMTMMVSLSIVVFIWIQSCQKPLELLNPDDLDPTIDINGEIRDPETNEPLSNVCIQILCEDKEYTTDENGEYTFENLRPGFYSIIAQAEGRITTIAQTEVLSFLSSTNTTFLPEINKPVLVQASGDSITESLADGRSYTLNIPAQALSSSTNISITPLEGIVLGMFPEVQNAISSEIHPLPSIKVPVGTVEITNHSNNEFHPPLSITFDLPFKITRNSKLPVLEFDFNSFNNEDTGTYAIVDQDGQKATFQIEHVGRYSVLSDTSIQELNLLPAANKTLSKQKFINVYDGMILKTESTLNIETLFSNISNLDYSQIFIAKITERLCGRPICKQYNIISTINISTIIHDLNEKKEKSTKDYDDCKDEIVAKYRDPMPCQKGYKSVAIEWDWNSKTCWDGSYYYEG